MSLTPVQTVKVTRPRLYQLSGFGTHGSSGLMTRWSTIDNDNFLGDHHTPHGNEGSASEEASLLNNCYVLAIQQ